ncbi:MAG TPA: DUF3311 domain-containing protein [Gemmatimonadaceae bacterium]
MPADSPGTRRSRWRRYHLLALLPALGMLGGLPFANRVQPLILGLPFVMAWLVAWVIVTAAIMAWILRTDTANGLASDQVQGQGEEGGAGEDEGKTS